MSVALFLDTVPYGSFEELIAHLPDDAVASPRRSTIPLIAYWRRADALATLGLAPSGRVELRFEHPTPVRRGKGKASYTDLMIISDAIAVAIEAKFTEPRYETVDEWLGRAPSDNRLEVLDGWLALINEATGGQCTRESVSNLPYQIVHRTASVCAVDRPQRAIWYQLFKEPAPAFYERDLQSLLGQLPGTSTLQGRVLTCPATPYPEYQQLMTDWDRGHRGVSAEVRRLLSEDRAFRFSLKPVL
jgi:hypothetical protein